MGGISLVKNKWVLCIILLSGLMLGGCSSSRVAEEIAPVYVAGWLYLDDGLNTFYNNIGVFNEINPVWYNILRGGMITENTNIAAKTNLVQMAKLYGVKVIPTIQNTYAGGGEVVRKIINNPVLRARHVRDLVDLMIRNINDYDGIDIDYEELAESDAPAFSAFIRELSLKLAAFDKVVSVCVYYKSSNSRRYGQYWPELIEYVDTLKVMVYNYHYSTSRAGPICPTKWLQGCLEYARLLPGAKDKIIIGLPLYGYDWNKYGTGKARGVTYKDIQKLMRRHAISPDKIGWDNGESYFTYWEAGRSHIVYFQDNIAIWQRYNLVVQYRDAVKGITFWQLGGEDPEIWNLTKKTQVRQN
jgi:spore germination protein